jgi:hypothetical protein
MMCEGDVSRRDLVEKEYTYLEALEWLMLKKYYEFIPKTHA